MKRFKKFTALLGAAVLALSITACAGSAQEESAAPISDTVTVEHLLGSTEVPSNPQRIAVLDLAALDMIDAMELGDRVVGVPKSSSVSYLTAYTENEDIEDFGSVKEVNMEALMASEPDVIFIGTRLEEQYEEISKIAPVICLGIDYEKGYMESFASNLSSFSSIFGLGEKAEEISSGYADRLAKIAEAADSRSAVVGVVSSSSLSTLGNTSRCAIIGTQMGFENIAKDVDSTHGNSSSFELLVDLDPEYMFILDRDTAINSEGAKTAVEVMDNELVQQTQAYKNDNIVYLTPDVWYLAEGGITATDTMLRDIENAVL